MTELTAIDHALAELERLQAELAFIATREDDARKRDLVALRRKLSVQITEVGCIAEPIFANVTSSDMNRIYRSKFSAMRSATAAHQASWPAVLLDDRPAEYRSSARRVRAANSEFISWMRQALNQLRRL